MLQPNPWPSRTAALAVWLLAAASVAYWGLRLGDGSDARPAPLATDGAPVRVDPQAVARLLAGPAPVAAVAAAAPAASLASRFVLTGVAAGVRSGGGAAVIAVDGQPARPYRVGAHLAEGVVLQAVHARGAVLADGSGQPLVALELPPLKR